MLRDRSWDVLGLPISSESPGYDRQGGLPGAAFLERGVEVVEQRTPAIYAFAVVVVPTSDSLYQAGNSSGLRATEPLVLAIDVVNYLTNRDERLVGESETFDECLERAFLAYVREFGLEHVEAKLGRATLVATCRHELELRLRVDEAPDEPGARNAIHVDIFPCDPCLPRADTICFGSSVRMCAGRLIVYLEHRFDLLVREPFDKDCFCDYHGASLRLDLLAQPVKVFERLVRVREEVNGLLHRDRTNSSEAPPHFHAQVVRFGRELVNEEEPAGLKGIILRKRPS